VVRTLPKVHTTGVHRLSTEYVGGVRAAVLCLLLST
jgi:hypothetical protein